MTTMINLYLHFCFTGMWNSVWRHHKYKYKFCTKDLFAYWNSKQRYEAKVWGYVQQLDMTESQY